MRRLAFLLFLAGCAGGQLPAPAAVDLSAPVLLSAAGDDSVIAESLATVKAKIASAGEVRYPMGLQASGIQGTVRVAVVVLSNGLPDTSSVHVVATSDPRFDQSAVSAVLGSRFHPALLDGRRVAVQMTQTIHYRIEAGVGPPRTP